MQQVELHRKKNHKRLEKIHVCLLPFFCSKVGYIGHIVSFLTLPLQCNEPHVTPKMGVKSPMVQKKNCFIMFENQINTLLIYGF